MSEGKGGSAIKKIIIVIILATGGLFALMFVLAAMMGALVGGMQQQAAGIEREVISSGAPGVEIAVVDINGVIMPGKTTEDTIKILKSIEKNPAIKGVLLNIDTPGGGVTATDQIYHEIQKIRKKKQVVTCMNSMCASGGYYLAAGTDHIVANRLTLTGSVGVIISTWNAGDLMEKLGVRSLVYKSGELKDSLNPTKKLDDATLKRESELIQSLVDECFDEFARIVAEGRKLPLETVREAPIGDARILTGLQAKKAGLVDTIGYFEDAVDEIKKRAGAADAAVVRYKVQGTLLDQLTGAKAETADDIVSRVLPSPILKRGGVFYLAPGLY